MLLCMFMDLELAEFYKLGSYYSLGTDLSSHRIGNRCAWLEHGENITVTPHFGCLELWEIS